MRRGGADSDGRCRSTTRPAARATTFLGRWTPLRRYCAAAARRSSSPPPPPPPPLPRGTENVTPTVRGEPLAFRFGMKSSRVHAMAYAFYGVGFYGPRHSASMACAAASILLRRPPDLGAWRHGACMAYATAALHNMHECKRFFTIIMRTYMVPGKMVLSLEGDASSMSMSPSGRTTVCKYPKLGYFFCSAIQPRRSKKKKWPEN